MLTSPLLVNATLNLITHRFYEKCNCANIRFDVNIREARLDFMTAPDITALFDNLLENAYESASASDQRSIDFSAYIRNKNFLIIRLTNSCDVKPEYENGELKTTKSSPFHGIGTRSIKRIVKKYDGDIDSGNIHFIVLVAERNILVRASVLRDFERAVVELSVSYFFILHITPKGDTA
jgi:hypothetical protein